MIRSLGVTLALAFSGLQLLAVAIVVLSTYWTSEKALLAHARTLLTDTGINVIQHSKGFLSPARSAAEVSTTLAESRIVRGEQKALLERLLFRHLRAAPQFAGAYYGDEEGNFIYVRRSADGAYQSKFIDTTETRETRLLTREPNFTLVGETLDPDDTYDPRSRVWYQKAKAERSSIWTAPYIFFTSQSPGVTAATPVFAGDRSVQGVVGVDIEISAISEFLAQLRIGSNGSAFIVDQNGDVIAHPNLDVLKTQAEDGTFRFPSITEIGDPLARAAFGNRAVEHSEAATGPHFSDFDYMGAQYVSAMMPFDVDDIPWTIVVYAPEDDFIGPIKLNRNQNALIAFAVVLATGLLGLVLADRIAQPVRAFAVRSALISQGELDPDDPMPNTYRELSRANETLMREISQRRRSESGYRLAFDMASRGMVHLSPEDARILEVNERFAEMLGRTQEALKGSPLTDVVHPEDVPLVRDAMCDLATQDAFGLEVRALHTNGDIIWISLNGIFLHDPGTGPEYVIATIDDITQGKADEHKIETLSREIARFTRQNVAGELATGLAHELNQPLTAITQNVDSALHIARSGPTEQTEMTDILTEIDQQAHHAADIIRALRSFVRKDDDIAKDFDIRELIVQAARLVKNEARENGVDIRIAPSPAIQVRAVRLQVAQVVVNILRNAIEAIAESGAETRVITARVLAGDDEVRVEIEDTGPGVSSDITLFSAFETTKSGGMGLGLMISRSLIEANGGTLVYASDDGVSRFVFTLRPAT